MTVSFLTSKRGCVFLFTIMFYFFSCSVWHICCCLVGRLCSPVINLFCRSPSALCLVLFSIPFSSSSYSPLPTFLPALLSPLTSHTVVYPPPPRLITNLSPFRLLPLPHNVLSENMRGVHILYVRFDMLCKDTYQQQDNNMIAKAAQFYLRTNYSLNVFSECHVWSKFFIYFFLL